MSKVVVRCVQTGSAKSKEKNWAWVVLSDEKEVSRFPGRAAARELARELRRQEALPFKPAAAPVFEDKERNPFIEGPAPKACSYSHENVTVCMKCGWVSQEPANNQTAEVMKEFMTDPTTKADRYATTDGKPPREGYENATAPAPIEPTTGQHEAYWVLSEEDRKKGWVRPLRRKYIHKMCGTVTSMGLALCETYAKNPGFYSHTFCMGCNDHLPVSEFTWDEDGAEVGS